MKPYKNVEAYLKQFPEDQRQTLEKVRKAIREAAPEAEETISYGMPAYKWKGALVYFAGFQNHCSFFPGSYSVMREFEAQLSSFETKKGTIRFAIGKPLPSTLIKKLVRSKLRENEARAKAGTAKKKKPTQGH